MSSLGKGFGRMSSTRRTTADLSRDRQPDTLERQADIRVEELDELIEAAIPHLGVPEGSELEGFNPKWMPEDSKEPTDLGTGSAPQIASDGISSPLPWQASPGSVAVGSAAPLPTADKVVVGSVGETCSHIILRHVFFETTCGSNPPP